MNSLTEIKNPLSSMIWLMGHAARGEISTDLEFFTLVKFLPRVHFANLTFPRNLPRRRLQLLQAVPAAQDWAMARLHIADIPIHPGFLDDFGPARPTALRNLGCSGYKRVDLHKQDLPTRVGCSSR